MSDRSLKSRRALVLGGSGGIGFSISRYLLRRGATVLVHGRSEERLRSAREALIGSVDPEDGEGTMDGAGATEGSGAAGPTDEPGAADAPAATEGPRPADGGNSPSVADRIVTLPISIEDADSWSKISMHVGELDICVVSYGPFLERPFAETSVEEWRRMYEMNAILPARVVAGLLPGMRERGFGRIVLFGGTGTDRVRGFREIAAYSSAKTALGVVVKSAALEVGPANVTVNGICPGMVETEYLDQRQRQLWARRMPTGSLVDPERIAEAVGFLVSPENRATNGVLLPIDEGLTAR